MKEERSNPVSHHDHRPLKRCQNGHYKTVLCAKEVRPGELCQMAHKAMAIAALHYPLSRYYYYVILLLSAETSLQYTA
jgi:hypothetical protein